MKTRTRKPPTPSEKRTVTPPTVDAARFALAQQSGIFDAEEAALFLRFPSVEAFQRNLRRFKVRGVRIGNSWRYSREALDSLRGMVYGINAGRKRVKA